ncbi:MAG TPA: hypothetical protein VI894_04070 [Candidatus Nanoarchaeia archaeon]|nr:hypothetical protein [Candidatus Nanoarchaeia archaeon]
MMMELRSRRERPLATLVDKIVLWNFDLKDAMHILFFVLTHHFLIYDFCA